MEPVIISMIVAIHDIGIPIGIAYDIKQMYLQIEIEEKACPYFRILWRDYESDREPDEYEFTRVVFGKNSAPMEPIMWLKKMLVDSKIATH